MEELNKKKVTELKQELKERGLATSGTKPELVKRLFEALQSSETADVEDLDDDDILNEETPVSAPVPTVTMTTTTAQKVSAPADSASANGESQTAKAPVTEPSQPSNAGDSAMGAKPQELSKLSDAEKLKLRAERFGGAVSSEAKKEMRAQRFGLPTNTSSKIDTNIPVDVDVLKKRAERFGTVVSSSLSKADENERKRKRAERFGTSEVVSIKSSNGLGSADEEIKKKQRAERFGLAS